MCVAWPIHMCDIHVSDMTHSCVWHAPSRYVVCVTLTHTCMCDTTHSYVWHSSFLRVTRLWSICLWVAPLSYAFVTCLIHICDIAHSYVSHDSVDLSYERHDALTHTHSYVWRDSSIHVTWLHHMCGTTQSTCRISDTTHSHTLIHMRDKPHS